MPSNKYDNMAELYNLSLERINEIVIETRAMLEDVHTTIASLEKIAKEKENELDDMQDFIDNGLQVPGVEVDPDLVAEYDAIKERIALNHQRLLYCITVLENMVTLRQIKIIQKYGTKISLPQESFVTELENYVNSIKEQDVSSSQIGFRNK